MTGRLQEGYVDARELAHLMAVSERTIKRWVALGMPSETWGIRTRRFLPSQAIAWARARTTMDTDNRRSGERTNATRAQEPRR